MTFNVFPIDFVSKENQSIQLPSARIWTKHPAFKGFLGLKNIYGMYDNPTARKTVEIAAYLFGGSFAIGACLATGPVSIGLIVTSAAVFGITYLASRTFNCLIPMRHDMKNHEFRTDRLEKNGVLLGSLYYNGDVPVLKIETTDPYETGYTHGYLLRKEISAIRKNIDFCLHTLFRFARPSKLRKTLDQVKSKIPEHYLKELEGVVAGYNAKKTKFETDLTLDDLLFLQLMPDMEYMSPNVMYAMEKGQQQEPNFAAPLQIAACTITALFDETKTPLMARSMDWQSFGNIGKYSLIISRINATTGIRTAEVAVPGLLGVVTGVNNHGVSVAMNVAPYSSGINMIEGIPSAFYNRLILDSCTSFDTAATFVAANKSLGPYHLTIADHTTAGTFFMYQQQNFQKKWNEDRLNGHKLRLLENNAPLVTTNCSCTPDEEDLANGKLRKEAIHNYLEATEHIEDRKKVLSHLQTIPFVNKNLTTHRVIMGPKTLEVAFDNAWAGDRELHVVDLLQLFS